MLTLVAMFKLYEVFFVLFRLFVVVVETSLLYVVQYTSCQFLIEIGTVKQKNMQNLTPIMIFGPNWSLNEIFFVLAKICTEENVEYNFSLNFECCVHFLIMVQVGPEIKNSEQK